MQDYPKLLPHQLWTMAETGDGTEELNIEGVCLKAMEYEPDVYKAILAQAKAYRIVADTFIERGSVVDGRQEDDGETTYRDVTGECIVVHESQFAGIFTLCIHKEKIKYVEHETQCAGILYVDGTEIGINYDEYLRNPGHWCLTTVYTLEKR